jgi:predicted small integral membrane protein
MIDAMWYILWLSVFCDLHKETIRCFVACLFYLIFLEI